MKREIVILAKSTKVSGYCIAGIDTKTGEWIRPISNDFAHEGAVPHQDIIYENGSELQLLDIVEIEFTKHMPSFAQPENHLYDNSEYWVKIGVSTIDKVKSIRGLDAPQLVFHNCGHAVSDDEIEEGYSLLLIEVSNPNIFIKTFPEKKKIQMNFDYKGISYSYFSISDPALRTEYFEKEDGRYRNFGNKATVVLSLTGKFVHTGKYYKMVAQIF